MHIFTGNVNFPRPVVDAALAGNLVIFAGAGVSAGAPAKLCDFKGLCIKIGEGCNVEMTDQYDRYLSKLDRRGVPVRRRAAEILELAPPQACNPLHDSIARLVQRGNSLITTNFDTLFEFAFAKLQHKCSIAAYPQIPINKNNFEGMVKIHGCVSNPTQMVLTRDDYANAYMENSALSNFLLSVLRNRTVLFIGYSYNDLLVSYLTEAGCTGDSLYALTLADECGEQKWKDLRITPISFGTVGNRDFSALEVGVESLSELASRPMSKWRERISQYAKKKKNEMTHEQLDELSLALSSPQSARYFYEEAPCSDWLGWLDELRIIENIASGRPLTTCDSIASHWLTNELLTKEPDILFSWAARRKFAMPLAFWRGVAQSLANNRIPDNWRLLWTDLLLSSIDYNENISHFIVRIFEKHHFSNGELVVKAFEYLTKLKPNATFGNASQHLRLNKAFHSSAWLLNEMWKTVGKPNLESLAFEFLSIITRTFSARHQARTWLNIAHFDEDANEHQQCLAPLSTVSQPTILVLAARDCLQNIAARDIRQLESWAYRHLRSSTPVLKQLAIYAVGLSLQQECDKEAINALVADSLWRDIKMWPFCFAALTDYLKNQPKENWVELSEDLAPLRDFNNVSRGKENDLAALLAAASDSKNTPYTKNRDFWQISSFDEIPQLSTYQIETSSTSTSETIPVWFNHELRSFLEFPSDVNPAKAWEIFANGLWFGLVSPEVLRSILSIFSSRNFSKQVGLVLREIIFAAILTVHDPNIEIFPAFFEVATPEDRIELGKFIAQMVRNAPTSSTIWDQWLRKFWANRLDSIPRPLEYYEIPAMLSCLPLLEGNFEDAVSLAVKMPRTEEPMCDLVYHLSESSLPETHPESLARLISAQFTRLNSYQELRLGKNLLPRLSRALRDEAIRRELFESLHQMSAPRDIIYLFDAARESQL